MDVLRDSSNNCLLIFGEPYSLSKTIEKISEKLIIGKTIASNGRIFYSYAHAPLYFSGSPYGVFLSQNGIRIDKTPLNFKPEFLPNIEKKLPVSSSLWAKILDLDESLLYK